MPIDPRKLAATAALALCLALGYAPAISAQSDAQEAATADTVLALTDEWIAAWQEMNPEHILQFYSEDLQYYWMGLLMPSREAFERALHAYILPETTSYRVEAVDPHVQVLGPDAAVVAFLFRGEALRRSGETDPIESAASLVFARRGGEWKIVHVHESAPESDAAEQEEEAQFASVDEAEREVRQVHEAYYRTLVEEGSDAALVRYYGDEFTYVGVDGKIIDKEGLRARMRRNTLQHFELEDDLRRVSVYGDVAVLSGHSTSMATDKGEEHTAKEGYTEVWVRRDGRWRLVAEQITSQE